MFILFPDTWRIFARFNSLHSGEISASNSYDVAYSAATYSRSLLDFETFEK